MNESDKFDPMDPKNQKTVGNPLAENPRMTCRDVNVYYGEKHAIKNVSLDIGRNEVIAMIGPSGCGKSTLVKMLAGLLPITGGRILVNDVVVEGPHSDIGIVFQQFNLINGLPDTQAGNCGGFPGRSNRVIRLPETAITMPTSVVLG